VIAPDAIVVTYRSAELIDGCLAPLVEAGLHVIVVDNEATADAVHERFPLVDLIANDVNRGFPAAVNQGLERSQGDVVLLVNPDCVVPPATSDTLVAHLRAHPDVAVVGPRLREPDGKAAISAHPAPTFATLLVSTLFPFGRRALPAAFTRLLARTRRWESYDASLHGSAAIDVPWLTGACLAVRSTFLRDELGGLDEGYFMYYEDVELCLAATQRGHRVVYLPSAEAEHVAFGSSADESQVWPIRARSALRFNARHRPSTFQVVRLALLLRALTGAVLGLLRSGRDGHLRRSRAWLRVAFVALTASRRTQR
jgi:N-acetylglucosaminyl-diphospho-decaprenol L-rhamnosyltransferase